MRKKEILIGSTFGRWTVLGEGAPYREEKGRKRTTLLVKCICGTNRSVQKNVITSGKSKSCGCLQKEIASTIGKKTGPINCRKYAHGWNRGLYGKNNPSYRGNNSKSVKIRNSDEYKVWRTKCFERDNYTCQVTGEKGGIVVHHLEPFHLIINDLDECNFRDNEILFDINNGITLGKKVHNLFHKEYGKKNFTKQNFLEFKQNYNNEYK